MSYCAYERDEKGKFVNLMLEHDAYLAINPRGKLIHTIRSLLAEERQAQSNVGVSARYARQYGNVDYGAMIVELSGDVVDYPHGKAGVPFKPAGKRVAVNEWAKPDGYIYDKQGRVISDFIPLHDVSQLNGRSWKGVRP